MPVVNMQTNSFKRSGSQIFTIDINFAPQDTFATATLVTTTGGGEHTSGIAGTRARPQPAGPEVPESFGNWPDWRASRFRPRMSGVTFGIALGANQTAKGTLTLYFF
jgi:hypothetical protein